LFYLVIKSSPKKVISERSW